jgi:hypothetical protein
MKDHALTLIENIQDPADKLNLLREYLQALVLRSLHEQEAFRSLAFVGGTALRFVHNLPRYSEDLDFSLESPEGYKGEDWMKKIKSDLIFNGFNVSMSWNDRTTVHKAWIKISDLLKEAGLTAMADQNLSIKLEIDTLPPAEAISKTSIINRHMMLALRYYDIPSLMAGKIHALLTRKYTKGRDWYDLMWYRGLRPPAEPNLRLLQNALDQTQGQGIYSANQWQKLLSEKVQTLDCTALVSDVENFLERHQEIVLLTQENILSVLS